MRWSAPIGAYMLTTHSNQVEGVPPVRVVLTGPESSGKTALTLHLARRFALPFAAEYARLYLEKHGPDYDFELLQEMSRGHQTYQNHCVPARIPVGLFDTDLTNYKIWSQEVFGRCSAALLCAEEQEVHHRYLLCLPDLPWEADPLRVDEDRRDYLYGLHVTEIERLERPYRVVRGIGPVRYACAEEAIRELVPGLTAVAIDPVMR